MTAQRAVYLDHSATTPVDPRVVEVMLPYFTEIYGNPSSAHSFGRRAERAVEDARETVARALNCQPSEIVFTGGGSEGDNLALRGAAWQARREGRGAHVLTPPIEHNAVTRTAEQLAEVMGFRHTFLPVDVYGTVAPAALEAACEADTVLASVMYANNEVGTVEPVQALAAAAHRHNVLFHTDAVQAAGQLSLDVQALGVDLLSLSAHKFYGPKGVGALYVRRRRPRIRLTAIQEGGGQERGFRSGTLNVPGIVGLGAAAEICRAEMDSERERLLRMRQRLEKAITTRLDVVQVNGHAEKRLPHLTNISFGFVEGESLMMACKDVAMSSGSACTSASLEPSYVLKGLGVGDDLAHSSLRFSLGRWTTDEEVDYVIDNVVRAVEKLRLLSPLYDMHQEGIDITKIEWQAH